MQIQLEHELYTASEVALMLRLKNPKTLYGWIKRGKLTCIRTPTGGIRIRHEEVERLLSTHVVPGEGGVDITSST